MRCARTLVLQGSVSIVALLASAFVGGASATGPGVAPRIACASLTGLTLPQTQILSATQKANYCNVIGVINKRVSSQDPDHFTYGIGFALNLPNTWFGRFDTIADYWRMHYQLSSHSLEQLLDAGWEGPVDAENASHEPNPASLDPSQHVQQILRALPEHQREVLTCRFLLSLSIKETAQRLGLTETNVKVLQFRALKHAATIDSQYTHKLKHKAKQEVE